MKQPIGSQLLEFDRSLLREGQAIVGIDEAGRGALAGPVVASAVRAGAAFFDDPWTREHCLMVDDSKRLSPALRQAVVRRFDEACAAGHLQIGIGSASVAEIDRFNILGATVLAMSRAVQSICPHLDPAAALQLQADPNFACPLFLIDGKPLRRFPWPHRGIVKGDRTSFLIALAGIHAKEARDDFMRLLDPNDPYGFAQHKGYGTAAHCLAIRTHGPSPHHRALFLRKLTASTDESALH